MNLVRESSRIVIEIEVMMSSKNDYSLWIEIVVIFPKSSRFGFNKLTELHGCCYLYWLFSFINDMLGSKSDYRGTQFQGNVNVCIYSTTKSARCLSTFGGLRTLDHLSIQYQRRGRQMSLWRLAITISNRANWKLEQKHNNKIVKSFMFLKYLIDKKKCLL